MTTTPPLFRARATQRRAALAFVCALTLGAGIAGCGTDPKKPDPLPTADPSPATSTPREADPAGVFYEVKTGDTLWSIANHHRIAVEELVEVNGLESAALIAPGQLIFIPDDDPLALQPQPPPDKSPSETLRTAPVTSSADLMWPIVEGVILRDFDRRASKPYDGLLFAAPAGTPVSAADSGKVLYAGDEGSAFGTLIIVEHPKRLVTVYAHLDGVEVEVGQQVKRGAVIGRVGSSGRAESPQLHFQVREDRTPVDPLTHLPPP